MREQIRLGMRSRERLSMLGRLSLQALSRAVAAGLIIAVLAFAAASTGRTLVMSRAIGRMDLAVTVGDAFADARAAADAEESLDRLYQLAPAFDARRQHLEAATSLVASLLVVRQHGDGADIRMVDRVLLDHTRYLAATEQLYAAVDRGDTASARTIDERPGDAELGNIADILGTAAARHGADELQARQELTRTEQIVSIVTPVASVIAVAFAALIWTVVRMYQVRLDEGARERMESVEQAAEAVRESEQRYRAIVETAEEGVWTVDPEAKTTFVNKRLAEMLGYTADEMSGRSLFDFMEEGDRALVVESLKRRRQGIPAEFEFKFLRKDGSSVWTIVHASGLHDQAGGYTGAMAMVTDISQRKQAELAVRQSEQRYRGIVETAQEGVWTIDSDAKTTFVNKRLAEMLGYAVDEMLGRSLFDFMDEADRARVVEDLRQRHEGIAGQLDFRFIRKDGSTVWTILQTSGLFDDEGRSTGALAMVTDISIRKQAEADRERLQEELVHQAFYDGLTGLPNRALFLNQLEHVMSPSSRRQPSETVLFLDLDGFKLINDSLGHDAGDELLKTVASRLTSCVRPEDTVARLGGDEFTILLVGVGKQKGIRVAERILETLSMPVVIQGQEVFPRASIGIAVRTSQADTANQVLRNADLAMYKAKAAGRDRYALFDPLMSAELLGRLQLEAELRRAIENEELRVYYQPLVSMSTGGIVALEALVRWQHPERGLLAPREFVPLAEETGLIVPIGEWVLRQACRQAVVWQAGRGAGEPLVLNVNVAARQFQALSLVETVRSVLEETGLPPGLLKLEVTESAVMADPANAVRMLTGLKAMGVQLAIDDFGTGYSSLGYLKSFPVDTLKVDRSFVEGLPEDEHAVALVRGVMALAKSLHLTVTGEGVETPEQSTSLEELGCDFGRGYLYGRPVPGDVTGRLLAAQADGDVGLGTGDPALVGAH